MVTYDDSLLVSHLSPRNTLHIYVTILNVQDLDLQDLQKMTRKSKGHGPMFVNPAQIFIK